MAIVYLIFDIVVECFGLCAIIGEYRLLTLIYGILVAFSLVRFSNYFRQHYTFLIVNIVLECVDLALVVSYLQQLTKVKREKQRQKRQIEMSQGAT